MTLLKLTSKTVKLEAKAWDYPSFLLNNWLLAGLLNEKPDKFLPKMFNLRDSYL